MIGFRSLPREHIAAGVERAFRRLFPEQAAAALISAPPLFGDRMGPRLPLPDLAWHGDPPPAVADSPADVAARRRCVSASIEAAEMQRFRDGLGFDFQQSLARAQNAAAYRAELAEHPIPFRLPPAPRTLQGTPTETLVLESIPRIDAPPPAPAEDAATAAALAVGQLDHRIECLRADLALRDDPAAGTRALRGEARRLAHNSLKLCLSLRSRLMLPALTERRAAAVEGFHRESEEQTGMSMSPEQYGEQQSRRLKLSEMAREICSRLERVGVQSYRDAGDVKLWRFFIHTQMLEELPQYRRICINPVVAAQSRSHILAALEYFIQQHPFCRFWTFTTGQRCFAHEIPERLDVFCARLRKLNSWMRKEYGLEIVIRTTEFGTLETHEDGSGRAEEAQSRIVFAENPQTGANEPTYHPHFHCVVYSLRGYRPRDEWTALCARVRSRWGFCCDFGEKGKSGVIQNAREIVKYVTKPGDVLKLSDPQLRAFFEATTNRRLVVPMGSLRKDIARRRDAELSLVRRREARGAWKWREVGDHNKGLTAADSPEQRAEYDDMVDASVFDAEMRRHQSAAPSWEWADDVTTVYADEVTREHTHRVPIGGREVPLRDTPEFCKVVAFIRPATGPTRRKENCVMVMGNRWDRDAVNRHPLVTSLRERTFTAWAAGELAASMEAPPPASGICLDTGTVSVNGAPPRPGGGAPKKAVQLFMETA